MNFDAFLRHLEVDATVLPTAPAGDAGQLIEHRRTDEVHTCLICGNRAAMAFLVETAQDDRRWLDLCMNHARDLYHVSGARMGDEDSPLFPDTDRPLS
jgi:hypothetical protein